MQHTPLASAALAQLLRQAASRYTSCMDSVRFGRVLGTGARLAAKTLVTAVDAATAPNPSATRPTTSNPHTSTASPQPRPAPPASSRPPAAQRAAATAARSATEVRNTTKGIARGGRRFGQAVWAPVVKLSGVLWLELTGVFFGVFALFASIATWKLRANLRVTPTNADAHTHLQLAALMAIVFGYFCATSFLRAHRRGRRP